MGRAMRDLEHAYEAVTVAASEPPLERQGFRKAVKSVLLLPLHSVSAKAVRAIYYGASALGLWVLYIFVGIGIEGIRNGEYGFAVFLAMVVTGLVALLPAGLLWQLVRILERRRARVAAGPRPPLIAYQPPPSSPAGPGLWPPQAADQPPPTSPPGHEGTDPRLAWPTRSN